jgi:hypothetical protein
MNFWQKYTVILVVSLLSAWALRSFVAQTYRVGQTVEFLNLKQGDLALAVKIFSLPEPKLTPPSVSDSVYLVQTRGSSLIWPARLIAQEGQEISVGPNGVLRLGAIDLLADNQFKAFEGQGMVLKKGEVMVYPLPSSAPQSELADFIFGRDEIKAKIVRVLF